MACKFKASQREQVAGCCLVAGFVIVVGVLVTLDHN